jgi:hypothetical protein
MKRWKDVVVDFKTTFCCGVAIFFSLKEVMVVTKIWETFTVCWAMLRP